MAKDKFDKAFEDMKSGKIQGPTNDDMGPSLRKDLNAFENEIMSRPPIKARKQYLEDEMANYNLKKTLAPKDKRVMIPGTVNEADTSSNRLNLMPEYKKGGSVSSASRRADGCAIRGKTRA